MYYLTRHEKIHRHNKSLRSLRFEKWRLNNKTKKETEKVSRRFSQKRRYTRINRKYKRTRYMDLIVKTYDDIYGDTYSIPSEMYDDENNNSESWNYNFDMDSTFNDSNDEN